MHSVSKVLDSAYFESLAKAQGEKPGRRAPAVTKVGKHVNLKAPALTRRLHKILKKQAKETAERVTKAYDKIIKATEYTDEIDRILAAMNAEGISEALMSIMTPTMHDSFKKATRVGLAETGVRATRDIIKQMDIKALEYTQGHGGQLIKEITKTNLDQMQTLLGRAIEEGMSTNDLYDSIIDMGTFSEARAEMIARTELAFAHVQGNVEGWRESGEVIGKRSILGDLHDVPDICDECADAGIVPLDDDFVPGQDYAPYHPNCICDVVPVLSDEE